VPVSRGWTACGATLVACASCGFPDYSADLGQGADSTVDDVQDAPVDTAHAIDTGVHNDADASVDSVEASDAAAEVECGPDSGTIDAGPCTSCALSKCNTEVNACISTSTCMAFITCTSTCRCETAAQCFEDCRTAHPSPQADAVIACLLTSCATECN
jgi:hypothetical protein